MVSHVSSVLILRSTTIYLKEEDQTSIDKAQEIKYSLEYTCLKDVTNSISICYDPNPEETLIDEDRILLEEYNELKRLWKIVV